MANGLTKNEVAAAGSEASSAPGEYLRYASKPRMADLFEMEGCLRSVSPRTFKHSLIALRAGDLVYVTVLGRKMIIINTAEVANELLEKGSAVYSNRPSFPLVDL